MSRYLRQSGQLTRLARLSQQTRLQTAWRLSAVPRLNSPATANATWQCAHPRFYSSKPPHEDGNDKKPNENPEAKDDESSGFSLKDFGLKPMPLPKGWVHLTEEEIQVLQSFGQKTQAPNGGADKAKSLAEQLRITGAPEEMRDIIQQMRTGKLSIVDRGKLMRCTIMVGDRFSSAGMDGQGSENLMNQNSDNESQSRHSSNSEQQSKSETPGSSPGEGKQGQEQGQQGQGKQNSGQKPSGQQPGVPIRELISTVVALVVFSYLIDGLSGMRASRSISWQEMRNLYLDKGLVKKFVVTDANEVRVELVSEATNQAGGRVAHVICSIPSPDGFDAKLEMAQNELGIPPAERIPVSYEPQGDDPIMSTLSWVASSVIFIGLLVYVQGRMMGGRGGGGPGGVFGMGKSRAKKFNAENSVKVKFADVAGLEEAKVEIMEFVNFLKQPEKFEKLGAKIPRGAILSGPPGTGKTLIAKATAGESGVPFFSVSGSEFVEMFVGVGPSRVRDLFAEGRKNAPCIIFIDEIDAIGRARSESGRGYGGGGTDERESTLNQILTEMDGFNTREQVVVLAGTNRADILDKALMRPGRFDRHIYIDRPTMKGRQEIFKVYLKKIVTNEDIEHLVGRLSTLTPGFAGADISNVVNEAALIAARENADDVKMIHFERAIERVVGGLERKSLVLNPVEKKTVAYHEAGHAICGWFLEHADPLLKVSIIPRGQGALGYAQYLPQDVYLMNREQLMDRMAMTMGGRVSEELHFPTVTTGASDDFRKVSKMARDMVTQWGMSDKVGPMFFENDPNQVQKPFAESTAQQIDQEVSRIVANAHKQCKDLLVAKKKEVGLVAEELLKKEVLVRDDMVRLLGPRPFESKHLEFEKFFGGQEKSAPPPPPGEAEAPGSIDPAPAFKALPSSESSSSSN